MHVRVLVQRSATGQGWTTGTAEVFGRRTAWAAGRPGGGVPGRLHRFCCFGDRLLRVLNLGDGQRVEGV